MLERLSIYDWVLLVPPWGGATELLLYTVCESRVSRVTAPSRVSTVRWLLCSLVLELRSVFSSVIVGGDIRLCGWLSLWFRLIKLKGISTREKSYLLEGAGWPPVRRGDPPP